MPGGSKQQLRDAGLRVTGDYRAEKLGSKIRDAQLELIPYMLVVGERDAEQGTVSVRDRIDGDQGAMPVADGDRQASGRNPGSPSAANRRGHAGGGGGLPRRGSPVLTASPAPARPPAAAPARGGGDRRTTILRGSPPKLANRPSPAVRRT